MDVIFRKAQRSFERTFDFSLSPTLQSLLVFTGSNSAQCNSCGWIFPRRTIASCTKVSDKSLLVARGVQVEPMSEVFVTPLLLWRSVEHRSSKSKWCFSQGCWWWCQDGWKVPRCSHMNLGTNRLHRLLIVLCILMHTWLCMFKFSDWIESVIFFIPFLLLSAPNELGVHLVWYRDVDLANKTHLLIFIIQMSKNAFKYKYKPTISIYFRENL